VEYVQPCGCVQTYQTDSRTFQVGVENPCRATLAGWLAGHLSELAPSRLAVNERPFGKRSLAHLAGVG
jgi:hypothetical protein